MKKKLIVLASILALATPHAVHAETQDYNKARTVRIWPMPLDITKLEMGSGFFVEGGQIITNDHVGPDATQFMVNDGEGHSYTANLVARDKNSDLAILSIDDVCHPYFELGSKAFIGQNVSFIGSTFTEAFVTRETMVSQYAWINVGSEYQGERMVMTTDGIQGYSGGPVIDKDNKIVGVMEAGSNGLGSAAVELESLQKLLGENPVQHKMSLMDKLRINLSNLQKRFKGGNDNV